MFFPRVLFEKRGQTTLSRAHTTSLAEVACAVDRAVCTFFKQHTRRNVIIRAMLVELAIENYAVVESLRVRFHAGLNLLSGETGSGKSIVVDALGLLLGARTSGEMIRSGAERARVSGIFEVSPTPALLKLLEDTGHRARRQ